MEVGFLHSCILVRPPLGTVVWGRIHGFRAVPNTRWTTCSSDVTQPVAEVYLAGAEDTGTNSAPRSENSSFLAYSGK